MTLSAGTSAIAILSDDVLSTIFLHYKIPAMPMRTVSDTQDFAPCNPDADPRDKTWLHISHVCRRWRAISLSCLTIWSTINVTSPRSGLVLASLERAKHAPLTSILDCTLWYYTRLDVLAELAAQTLFHLSHTRHLLVRGELSRSAYERVIPIMQGQEADMLETIQLSTERYVDKEEDEDEDELHTHVILPDALFLHRAPRLHKVALHGAFSFTCFNTIFSGRLTHLSLSHVVPKSLPSIEVFLDLLGRYPLQLLSLVASLPNPAVEPSYLIDDIRKVLPPLPAAYDKIYLPQLQRCYLEDRGLEISDFIRRVEIPQSCHISLYFGRQDEMIDASGTIPSPLSPILQSVRDFCLSRNTLHEPSLRFSQRRGSRAHWTFAGNISDDTESQRSVVELSMGGTADPDVVHVPVEDAPAGLSFLSGIFLMVSAAFPPQTVRSAHISVRSLTCRLFWDVMMYLENLESLTIEGPSAHGFAEMMEQYVLVPQAPLAKLRELTVANVDMTFPVIVGQMVVALRGRREHELPPLSLTLRQCDVGDVQLQKLETAGGREVMCEGEPDVWELERVGEISSDEEYSEWENESEHWSEEGGWYGWEGMDEMNSTEWGNGTEDEESDEYEPNEGE